jgi:hypothetical protein
MGRMTRRTCEEKREIIHLVEHSELPRRHTLGKLNVLRSTFDQAPYGASLNKYLQKLLLIISLVSLRFP